MFFAAVLIFINSSVFSLDREPENSFVQADFFIEALLTDADAFEYFWGLNELASAHPGVEQYAVETLRNLNLPAYGACLLQSFANADHIETASQRKLERLRMGFECKRDAFLLIAYLYEMPPSQAPSYAKEMNPVPAATGPQTALINKAVGKPYDVEQLFAPRPFELSDIYLFHRLSFEPEKAHFINDLLDRWTQQYLRTGSHRMRHHLMLATIVNGQSHHSSGRNSQDHKVYEVLHLFNDGELMLPNSKYKLNLYKRLGFSTNFIGNYRDAVQFYRRRVLPLSELIHDKQEQLRVRLDFGTILFRTGNLQAARQEYETVYNDSTGIQDSRYRSELMNNLAVTYLNSGNFTDYLQFQLDALNESNEANYINGKLHYLNNLAIYYQKSENWSSALSYLNAAARIAEDADIPAELSTIYRSIGIYERDQNNDFETAVFYLSASENLAIESGSYRQLLVTRSELSDTYIRMSEPERALEIYHKIEKEAFERDNHSGWLEVQAQIASLYLGQQMIEEAGQYIHLLEDSSIENLQFRPRVEAVNVLAEYYFKTDEPGKGYALSELYTRQIIERLQNSADYQSGHLRIDKEFIHNFQITTDLLLHSGKEEQVLTFFDELKNVSKFSFYNNPALKSNLLNEEELFYDYALGNRIERLRNERRGAGASDMMAINNQISLATNERNKLTERVLGELDREAFDLDNVQQKLKRDEVILYYTLFRNKLYLATISSSDVKITNQTFSTGEMRRMEQAIKDLSNGDTRLGELHWIYNKIIPADVDDSYNKLIVVPDGFLYRLPLDVLPVSGALSDHSFGSARYLIEDFAVTYVNSLKDFEDTDGKTTGYETDYLGFGISNFEGFRSNTTYDTPLTALPFAENEVMEISNTLTRLPNKIKMTANRGTESAFRSNAGRSRVMHVASHSEVFHPDPLYSVIYLHGNENNSDYKDDGLVYAYELFEMDLTNEMVMLSSCESGSGSYIQGSGIVGLSRAFSYAGARSLVMNLWSVRDQTASSMAVSFYEYLNQGYSKDAALRKTKVDYINTSNSDPYLWGSFVVYGDDAPLVNRPLSVYWILIGLGIALLMGVWYMKKE